MTTDNKMQIAVNHVMNERQIIAMRQGILSGGMGLDQKRVNSYCEYGYPENVCFNDYLKAFKRNGIASAAVNKLVDHCWSTDPWIIEGDEDDNKEGETPWEKSNESILVDGLFWREFQEADRRRLVGKYAGILLQINDNTEWNLPVKQRNKSVKLIPAWAGSLSVSQWDESPISAAYGKPKMWQYEESGVGNATGRVLQVHPDRIFILGDYHNNAIGYLEPVFNNFVNLEKVEGASAESLAKNAARQVHLNFDKEIDFDEIANMYGVDKAGLAQAIEDAAVDLNRGNDVLMATQGATATPLVSAVADPRPTYEVNLQTVSAGVDIPTKIITGMQTGERASTEDQKYFNKRCQSRRKNLGYEIKALIYKLTNIGIILPIAKFTVMWDDLTEATFADKLANGNTMAEINNKQLGSGEATYSNEEIREATGFENDEPLPPLTEELPDDEDA